MHRLSLQRYLARYPFLQNLVDCPPSHPDPIPAPSFELETYNHFSLVPCLAHFVLTHWHRNQRRFPPPVFGTSRPSSHTTQPNVPQARYSWAS